MLNRKQLNDFVRLGYLVLPRLIDVETIEELLAVITPNIESEIANAQFQAAGGNGGVFFTREQLILELFASEPINLLLSSLLTKYQALTLAQVASFSKQEDSTWPLGEMHVDKERNRMIASPAWELNVGIALQGGVGRMSGGLGVYPGTHRAFEKYFQQNPEKTIWDVDGVPPVDLPDVKELSMEAGDVVVFHPQFAHTSMPNQQETRRIAIYGRFCHPRHAEADVSRDIWHFYTSSVKEAAKQLNK